MMKLGKDLKVGDTIKVWWAPVLNGPTQDTIVSFKEGNGRMNYIWTEGYKYASFQENKVGLTIPNDEWFEVID